MNTNTQNKIIIVDEDVTFYIKNEIKQYTIKIKELINKKTKIDKSLDTNIIEKIIRKKITINDYDFNADTIIKIKNLIFDEEIEITIFLNIEDFKFNHDKVLNLNNKEKDKLLINLLKEKNIFEMYNNKKLNGKKYICYVIIISLLILFHLNLYIYIIFILYDVYKGTISPDIYSKLKQYIFFDMYYLYTYTFNNIFKLTNIFYHLFWFVFSIYIIYYIYKKNKNINIKNKNNSVNQKYQLVPM